MPKQTLSIKEKALQDPFWAMKNGHGDLVDEKKVCTHHDMRGRVVGDDIYRECLDCGYLKKVEYKEVDTSNWETPF